MSITADQSNASNSLHPSDRIPTHPDIKWFGKFQFQLLVVVLGVTIPVLIAVVVLISNSANTLVVRLAERQLQASNQAIAANISLWLDFNRKTLEQLALMPDITSMDPSRQKPVLESATTVYPYMYLVHTAGPDGNNVARSDQEENKRYSDRSWFTNSIEGDPFTVQSLIGRTSREPAVAMGVPIRDQLGQIVGVLGIASDLDDVTQEVDAGRIGETGFAYVIDAKNRVIAHPNAEFTSGLRNLSSAPPVAALRQAPGPDFVTFTDEQGRTWRAYVSELDNGWAVVVQQQTDELLSNLRTFQFLAFVVTAVGLVILLGLLWVMSRRLVQPVRLLTDTATAVAAGDLSRQVPVKREDEIGALATSFNSMTSQLRQLIGNLEQKVSDRTKALETVIHVSERLTSILDLEQLLQEMVDEIKEKFSYYHAHVYMLDDQGQKLVMAAGVGKAGKQMKAKGHAISLNAPTSLVARAARTGEVVRVDNVREATDWLANPLLPDTYSEMAVPIIAEDQVVGVLDVQQDRVAGLGEGDADLLRSLAGQVAIAVRNARLFSQTQAALNEAEKLQQLYLGEVWDRLIATRPTTDYEYRSASLVPLSEVPTPEATAALQQRQMIRVEAEGSKPASRELISEAVQGSVDAASTSPVALASPLKLRDKIIGVLGIHAADSQRVWTEDEIALIEAVSEQMSLALENARLFEETQRSAWHDRVVSESTTEIWLADEIEAVMRAAVAQLGDKLQASEVVLRLGTETK